VICGGFWFGVRLAHPLHRICVESGSVARDEGGSVRNQSAIEDTAGLTAGSHRDTCRVDALFVDEVLLDVEVALGRGVGGFVVRVSANDHEFGGRVAVKREGDVVKASLPFVVDADGTLHVAFKRDAAEGTDFGDRRWRRSDDRDSGVGGGVFAEIVDYVTSDSDRARWSAAGHEGRGGCGPGDLAGSGRVGVTQCQAFQAIGVGCDC